MRDPDRINRITYLLGRLWVKCPDQRLFQLLMNYTSLGRQEKPGTILDPFYLEDDGLEKELEAAVKWEYESDKK